MARDVAIPETNKPAYTSLRQLTARGLELHRAGNLLAAEQTYRSILLRDPRHADALHLLGLIEGRRDPSAGVARIQQAIAANPGVSAYHNNLGNLLVKTGELAHAEESYRRALRQDPRNADASLNLGKLLHGAGDTAGARRYLAGALRLAPGSFEGQMSMGHLEQAEGAWAAACACYRKAVTLAPGSAPAYLMLGAACTALKDWDKAESSLRRALAIEPLYADVHFNLGNLQRARGNLEAAAACYQRAIELAPLKAADAWNNLGVTLADMGRGEEALGAWGKAVELQPEETEALFNLGRQAAGAGETALALARLERVAALDPAHARALLELGNLERSRGRLAEAAARYHQAIALAPDEAAECWNNLGVTLAETEAEQGGSAGAAEAALLKAIQLKPEYVEAWFNLGKYYASGAEPAKAFEHLAKVLSLDPASARAHQELGVLQEHLGQLEEALASYARSLALDPACVAVRSNHAALRSLMGDTGGLEELAAIVREQHGSAEAHWTHSMGLLLHGRYDEGWKEYEWRLEAKAQQSTRRSFVEPRWKGEPLEGRTILVYAEQGLGDTLQFSRYAPLVSGRGGRVILEVQPALQRLLRMLPGVEVCLARGGRLPEFTPEFTFEVPLMSLPHTLGLSAIPAPVSPLPGGAGIGGGPGFRVGLAWAGAPGHRRDRLRSVPLAKLQKLGEILGVSFTSLQRGPAATELDECREGFRIDGDCGGAHDMLDTAAMIAGLDLVITVDTSIAHLAGTLGKPVWILLDRTQDWRWGLGSSRTAWYPSAELFRQEGSPDWESAIDRVAQRLREEASARMQAHG